MNIANTNTMNVVATTTDKVLDLVEEFCLVLSVTSIPFESKMFYKQEGDEFRIILAVDLMINDWKWYSICKASDNALLGLQLFTDIKEMI